MSGKFVGSQNIFSSNLVVSPTRQEIVSHNSIPLTDIYSKGSYLQGLYRRKLNQMLGKQVLRKLTTSFAAVAVLCVYSMVALAAPKDLTGILTVTGNVTVNGQPAISNSTIISGATVVTGSNSTALISLGKTGRIEVLEDSNLVLNFSENSIVGILSSGKARVSNAAGVATTITTKNATVIADAGQADSFLVEVECSHTHLDATAGLVTMREGSSDKQVAAGTSATAGNLAQTGCKPCLRPDSAPPVRVGGPWWLLLAAAGAVGASIFWLNDDEPEPGDTTIVVSPIRGGSTNNNNSAQ